MSSSVVFPNWIVRVVLAFLYWPMVEPAAEEAMLRRFVAPALGGSVSS